MKILVSTISTGSLNVVATAEHLLTCTYSAEEPYAAEGREILQLIRKKAEDSEIQTIIDRIHEAASSLGVTDPLIPSTDVYVTCICHIGNKSLSHVLSFIDLFFFCLLDIGVLYV